MVLAILVFLFFSLLRSLWQSPSSKRMKENFAALPQVPKQIPFFGLSFELALLEPTAILNKLSEWAADGLAATYMVGFPYAVINDPELLESLLGSKNHITKGRQYESIKKWLNTGLLTSTGDKWHSRRKLLTPAFHFQILESNMPILNKSSNVLVDKLRNVCGLPVEIDKYITACTLDFICESVMGISLDTQRNESHDYLSTVKQVTYALGLKEMNFYYHIDWIFRLSPQGRLCYKNIKKLHAFTESVIRDRKEYYEKFNSPGNENKGRKLKAFLDLLIETEISNKGSFSFLDMREEVDTFMFEGHDTTAVALNFAIYLLSHHPEVQGKIFEEIEEILREGRRDFTMADLNLMKYLEKVIKESLRLYPSVPYFARELTQDLHLKNGKIIPATTNIAVVPYSLHRSEKYWPEPEKFIPERFNEEEIAKRHPYSYIPFSAGARNCIGKKLAMMELKVVLASLVRDFRIEPVTKSLTVFPFVILRNKTPITVKFIER